MHLLQDFKKAWEIICHPETTFTNERELNRYWPIIRFYLTLNIVLAVFTPIVNFLHIPCDIVHAGTNAQMGAFVMAPDLEVTTGISRYIWVGVITYVYNIAKFPILGLMFHIFAKILKGDGSLLVSFKVGVYAASPVLLFGWIPYFGLVSGLWVGYLYVIAFKMLHNSPLGPTIALVNLMIGVQLVWAFVFGWLGSSTPW
ncbi:MAG: hypothetical protein PVG65_05870 [Candidatus Thorarchaeota archaeon]|jgi:hypothetical protein